MAAAKNSGDTMSRSDLVSKVAEDVGLSQSQVDSVVRAFEGAIRDALAEGNEVRLSDLGKFSVSHRAERQGRNPQTGEAMTVAARSAPKFTPAKAFKDAIGQANAPKKGKTKK